MGIFRRLIDWMSDADRGGIRLEGTDPWEVGGTDDVERFLRALPLLCPSGGFVYFEGTGERHIAAYLRSVSVAVPVRLALGTIWPRPDLYHVPLTAAALESLANFHEKHPAGFFCAHCHVHDGASVLLQWHDAFGADPMLVSALLREESVRTFAAAVGRPYQRASASGA